MVSDYGIVSVLKCIFLLLPGLLFIVGAWCSMVAIYTYPFRRNRNMFVVTLFINLVGQLALNLAVLVRRVPVRVVVRRLVFEHAPVCHQYRV